MNIWVRTVDGELHTYHDVEVAFDADVVQVTYKKCTTTFPLANVLAFSTGPDVLAEP